jgi:metallo-beta-lactamase family protein
MIDSQSPKLRFLGGAQTVTGSKYLLSFNSKKILVDCGLFQGLKELRLKNWDRFPIDPKTIDSVVLTHAHIDHSGYIPRLVKEGFRGRIYSTTATFELCQILLRDAGHLQEEEAEYSRRKKTSKHNPPLPLFTKEDAEKSLQYFVPKELDQEFEIAPEIDIRFRYAGHILGAASVIVRLGKSTIAFSGDVGRLNDPILKDPAPLPQIDYLVVESTYGDRVHQISDPLKELEEIVKESAKQGGVILMPAFAVGRAQTLMYFLSKLKKTDRIPNIPIFLNSPMATSATALYHKFRAFHKLSEDECNEMCDVAHYVSSVEESKALNQKNGPMLIVSASGMATGGRILHHLKAFASDPKNVIVLAGFQATGTRGRAIQDGAKEIKIFGDIVPIRAKIRALENLSAHADYMEILEWLGNSQINPKQVFVTHGERESTEAMKKHIVEKFHWLCEVPSQDQEFTLG